MAQPPAPGQTWDFQVIALPPGQPLTSPLPFVLRCTVIPPASSCASLGSILIPAGSRLFAVITGPYGAENHASFGWTLGA